MQRMKGRREEVEKRISAKLPMRNINIFPSDDDGKAIETQQQVKLSEELDVDHT